MAKLLVLLFTLSSSFASAIMIEGYVTSCEKGTSYCLLTTGQMEREFKLAPGSVAVSRSLVKLSNGDLLTGSGVTSQSTFTLNGIDFVGLKKLIGCWSSPANSKYYFHNFSRVTTNDTHKTVTIDYTIVPGKDNQWVIFFIHDEDVITGNLEFISNDNLKISSVTDNSVTLPDIYLQRFYCGN
jgi:hypothetical protein